MPFFKPVLITALGLVLSGIALDAQAQNSKPAVAGQCGEHLKAHGLLSRAYAQCHYSFYSRGFTIQAEDCIKKLGGPESRQWQLQGSQAFDERSKEIGHAALCAKIVKDFPYTVRQ